MFKEFYLFKLELLGVYKKLTFVFNEDSLCKQKKGDNFETFIPLIIMVKI